MSFRKILKRSFGRLGIKNLKHQYDFSSAETTTKNNATFSDNFEREYNKFAKLIFKIEGKSYESLTGFREMKGQGGFAAEGTFAFEGNICQWQSKITVVNSKEGEFNAQCPNGLRIDGDYTYASNGSSGFGVDNFGRSVKFTTIYTKEANQFTFKKLMAEILATSSYIASSEGKTIDEVINRLTDSQICQSARHGYLKHIQEAKRRGLSCGVNETSATQTASSDKFGAINDEDLCKFATYLSGSGGDYTVNWAVSKQTGVQNYVKEAKRRGLSCGVGASSTIQIATSTTTKSMDLVVVEVAIWIVDDAPTPQLNPRRLASLT